MKSLFTRFPALEIYVFRKIFFPSFFVIGIILAVLSMERILRLVQLITSNGLAAHEAFNLVVCLLPHYLSLAVPAGFFLGTMIGIRNLHEHSELVVMRTFGMTARRIRRPILVFAIALCSIMFYLSGFVQPHARYSYRERLNRMTEQNVFAGLREGVFYKIGDKTVIRADRILSDGNTFEGFFMTQKVSPESRVYVTAKRARIVEPDEFDQNEVADILLSQGVFLEEVREKVNFQMSFQEMPASFSTKNLSKKFGDRGRDERELTSLELLAGGIPGRPPEVSSLELNTEWHVRILNVLSLPVLGILAIPMALIGQGRGARAKGLIIGLVLFVAYEKLLGVGEVMTAGGRVSPLVGLWAPWGLLILLTIVLFTCYSGDAPQRGGMDSIRHIWQFITNSKTTENR